LFQLHEQVGSVPNKTMNPPPLQPLARAAAVPSLRSARVIVRPLGSLSDRRATTSYNEL